MTTPLVTGQNAPLTAAGPWTLSVSSDPPQAQGGAVQAHLVAVGTEGRALGPEKVMPGGAIAGVGSPQGRGLPVDLSALPADIAKLVMVLSAPRLAAFTAVTAEVRSADGSQIFTHTLDREHAGGQAALAVELYLRNGAWKVRAVGQGFASGLPAVAQHFGLPASALAGAPPAAAPMAAPPRQAAPTTAQSPAAPRLAFGRAAPAAPATPNPPERRAMVAAVAGMVQILQANRDWSEASFKAAEAMLLRAFPGANTDNLESEMPNPLSDEGAFKLAQGASVSLKADQQETLAAYWVALASTSTGRDPTPAAQALVERLCSALPAANGKLSAIGQKVFSRGFDWQKG